MTLLSLAGVTRRFGGLVAVDAVDLEVGRWRRHRRHRPQRRRQDHAVQPDFRLPDARRRPHRVRRRGHHRAAAGVDRGRRPGPHLSARAALPEPVGAGEHQGRAAICTPRAACGRRCCAPRAPRRPSTRSTIAARELLAFVGLEAAADCEAERAPLWPAAAAGNRPRARRAAPAAAARRARRRALAEETKRLADAIRAIADARHDRAADRARHEARDEHRRHHRGARFRQEDRRRHARRGPRRTRP